MEESRIARNEEICHKSKKRDIVLVRPALLLLLRNQYRVTFPKDLTVLIAGPSYHGVELFQVGDGRDSVQVWTVAANISHVASVMAGKWWSSNLAVGRWITIRYRKTVFWWGGTIDKEAHYLSRRE